jgi:hypothetical protein
MASRWDVVDQQVARALEDDKGKEFDQLYYALRSRTVLLYLMFHLRELIMLARGIRLYTGIVALLLVLIALLLALDVSVRLDLFGVR